MLAASIIAHKEFVGIINDKENVAVGEDQWLYISPDSLENKTHTCLTTPWFIGCSPIKGDTTMRSIVFDYPNPKELLERRKFRG